VKGKINPSLLGLTSLVALALILAIWRPWLPQVVVGDMRINHRAKLADGKQYTVVVWDYELPLPWSELSHGDMMRQVATEFMQMHPNITVELVIRPWLENEDTLYDALANGSPPDVASLPTGGRLLSVNWQIPLEHYLTKEEAADIHSAAWQANSAHGHLWTWPRYIDPARWAVYMPRWQEACAEENLCGQGALLPILSPTEWTAMLAACRSKFGGCGLAANLVDGYLFYELAAGISAHPLLTEDGTLGWDEKTIIACVNLLSDWQQKGFLPKDAQAAARSRLGSFWSGRSLALAPTTPWLWHHLWQRSGVLTSPDASSKNGKLEETEQKISWIAPPTTQKAVLINVPGYAVFRQQNYQGDDQTQAAVMVAKYFSRSIGNWEATVLFGIPAYPSAWTKWQEESRLPTLVLQAQLQWIEHVVTMPADDKLLRAQQQILRETLAPGLLQVLQGTLSADDFAQRLLTVPTLAVSSVSDP